MIKMIKRNRSKTHVHRWSYIILDDEDDQEKEIKESKPNLWFSAEAEFEARKSEDNVLQEV